MRISITELARLSGVNHATLSRVTRGKCDIQASTLDKISAALIHEERCLLERLLQLHPDMRDAA